MKNKTSINRKGKNSSISELTWLYVGIEGPLIEPIGIDPVVGGGVVRVGGWILTRGVNGKAQRRGAPGQGYRFGRYRGNGHGRPITESFSHILIIDIAAALVCIVLLHVSHTVGLSTINIITCFGQHWHWVGVDLFAELRGHWKRPSLGIVRQNNNHFLATKQGMELMFRVELEIQN